MADVLTCRSKKAQVKLIRLMMAALHLGEFQDSGIVHVNSLTWFIGTINGMEPLLMVLFIPVLGYIRNKKVYQQIPQHQAGKRIQHTFME